MTRTKEWTLRDSRKLDISQRHTRRIYPLKYILQVGLTLSPLKNDPIDTHIPSVLSQSNEAALVVGTQRKLVRLGLSTVY